MKIQLFKKILIVALAFCIVCLPIATVHATASDHFSPGYPAIRAITKAGFTLYVKTDQVIPLDKDAYYKVLPSDDLVTLDAVTIKSTGTKIDLDMPGWEYSATISGLTQNTNYDVWVVFQGEPLLGSPILGTPVKLDATTMANDNADLLSLSTSCDPLTPSFVSNTLSYSASVPYSVTSIAVTPTLSDLNANVTVNGTPVASGSTSPAVKLAAGATPNIIHVVVTAENHTTIKDYVLNITRAPSDVCELLAVTAPVPNVFNGEAVSATVPYSTTSCVVAASTSPDATWLLCSDAAGMNAISSKTLSNLEVGVNTVYIKVIAQNAVNYKIYPLTVTRSLNSDATLSNLTINPGTLAPVFASATQAYTVTVGYSIDKINVTPTATDSNATVKVNETTVNSGNSSGDINLAVGDNAIKVKVIAQDTTVRTYTITVRRQSDACSVESVVKPAGGLISGTAIAANVSHDTVSAEVAVTVSPGASWKLFDASNVEITDKTLRNLALGDNFATIVVTAEDPTFKKTYTLKIKKVLSSDASLKTLSLSSGTLNPAFVSGTKSYTAAVANNISQITVTPTVNDPMATVKVKNETVNSGFPSQPIPLYVGDNTIAVKVTAANGSFCIYTITVRRLSNACELLSFVRPVDAYRSGNDWRVGIGYDITAVRVEVVVSPAATWKLYRDPLCTLELPDKTMLNLYEGENFAYIKVKAEDGTEKIYRVLLYRGGPPRSSNNRIQYLVLNGGTLNPFFSPYITSYTAHVPYGTSTVTVGVTTEFARADIRINGKWIISGGSAPISLAEGDNTLSIVIVAETGAVNTYTISVYRDFAQDYVVEIPETDDSAPVVPLAVAPLLLLIGLRFIASKRKNTL